MESKPFLLRFKFRDFVCLPSTPGKCVYSDRVYDRRNGNGWQLQLYPGGIGDDDDDDDDDDGGVGVFLHNVEGSDVYASTAFVLRDAKGEICHRSSSNDVDCYAMRGGCFGYRSFVSRSKILDDGVLLGGTLIIDVEVRCRRGAA
ncbi:hypothetical protein ACHAXA_005998 [Cyclostephanos tholiformis]|uniref:MATH domain-containing protein n=1 Tax=Cyclostephanos tholiformis TaxID=382380 RepID=A0ABD3SRV6_9STRA